MQESVLPECTAMIEPQVIDVDESSADAADPAMPELIAPCMPMPTE